MINASTPEQDIIGAETLEVIAAANKFNKWMYNEIQPYLKGEVLEIGCGIGNISSFVLLDGFTSTLSDFNKTYTCFVKKMFGDYINLKEVLSIDLQDKQFEQTYQHLFQQFDSIILLNVIEHLAYDNQAIEHCKFLLRPSGHLILLAPAYNWLYCQFDRNLGHYRRYTKSSLASLLTKKGFYLLKKKYFNAAGILGWLVYGKLLQQQKINENNMHLFNKLVPFFKFIDFLSFRLIGLSAIAIGKK